MSLKISSPFESPLTLGATVTAIGLGTSIILPLALKALGYSAGAIAGAATGGAVVTIVGLTILAAGFVKVLLDISLFCLSILRGFYSRY